MDKDCKTTPCMQRSVRLRGLLEPSLPSVIGTETSVPLSLKLVPLVLRRCAEQRRTVNLRTKKQRWQANCRVTLQVLLCQWQLNDPLLFNPRGGPEEFGYPVPFGWL
eukprot:1059201-Amphidinium_carterae.1